MAPEGLPWEAVKMAFGHELIGCAWGKKSLIVLLLAVMIMLPWEVGVWGREVIKMLMNAFFL